MAYLCQAQEHAIFLCGDMGVELVLKRMWDALWRVRLPVVAFGIVTGETTVDPICRQVVTATRDRLKMVHGQRSSNVGFANPTVPAAEGIALTEDIAFCSSHSEASVWTLSHARPVIAVKRSCSHCSWVSNASTTSRTSVRYIWCSCKSSVSCLF